MKNILILTTLIFGLIFTSLIKNKTRSLEKKLAKLNNEIIILNSNLEEATLDLEYLTTPKNISLLARNFLEEDFLKYAQKISNHRHPMIYLKNFIYATTTSLEQISLRFNQGVK